MFQSMMIPIKHAFERCCKESTHTEFSAFYLHKHQFTRKRNLVESIQLLLRPRQANLVLIAYASSEGSGEPAHPRSLARTSATRSYKQ